jgi:hypothetical protein
MYKAFAALGFNLTPLARQSLYVAGQPPEPWGTGSRYANFPAGGYLEVMGIVEPGRPSGQYAFLLESGLGTHVAKLQLRLDGNSSAENVAAAAQSYCLRYFRQFALADNLPRGAILDLVPLTTLGFAAPSVVLTHYHNPEVAFHPETLVHANGATRFSHVTLSCPNPQELAERFQASVLGLTPKSAGEDIALVLRDGSQIRLRACDKGRDERQIIEIGVRIPRPVALASSVKQIEENFSIQPTQAGGLVAAFGDKFRIVLQPDPPEPVLLGID